MWQLTVAGVVVPLVAEGFEVDTTIERRGIARLTVEDEDSDLEFDEGDAVELTVAATGAVVFGGLVDSCKTRLTGDHRKHDLVVTDWRAIADVRIAARAYEDTLAGDIVTDLHTRYLADEGVTIGTVEDGPTIARTMIGYRPVSEALDQLAEAAGFVWDIDAEKRLHFRPAADVAAPFDLDDDTIYGRPNVDRGNPSYRNRQYIRGGQDLTDPQTETRIGDGETRTFVMAFPLAEEPTVEVNAAAQTVGIKGTDTGKQWYWAKGDPVLSQDAGQLRLTSADTLEVTYVGQYSVVALVEDPTAIADRKAASGGTGWVEAVHDVPTATGRDESFEVGRAKLDRYARRGLRTVIDTETAGLAAGQTVRVVIPQHDVDESMIIESLRIKRHGAGWLYSATCVDGPTGSWADVFVAAAERASAIDLVNVGGGDVLARLVALSETWVWSEDVEFSKVSCTSLETAWDFATDGEMELC